MKPVSIDVELMSNSALDEIFGDGSFIASPRDGVKLMRPAEQISHGFGLGEVAAIVIDFGQHAPADFVHAMAAAWLYELFKNRARRITYKARNYRISEKDMRWRWCIEAGPRIWRLTSPLRHRLRSRSLYPVLSGCW